MREILKSTIKNEYVFSLVTRLVTISISLIQSIMIARYLGPALQGDMAFVTSISSIGAIIITFGMHQAYPYFRKKYSKEEIFSPYISIVFIHFFALTFILFFINIGINTSLNYIGALILIPIQGFANVVAYVCLIENPNKLNEWWVYTSTIEIIFISIMMLLFECDWYVAFSIYCFAEIMRAIVFVILLKPKVYFETKKLLFMYKSILSFGFFPMIALLLTTLNYKVDVVMLKQFDNVLISEIGVYSIGMAIADKIVLIPDTLKGVLVSKLSKGKGAGEVVKVCRLSFWANVIICILVIIFGKSVVDMLYGERYIEAYSVIIICSFGTIFVGYFKLIAQYNIVNKKQIRNVILLFVSVMINVILNLIFIPIYGINGAALASGFGYFFSGIIFVFWFAKKSNIAVTQMFLLKKEDFNYIKERNADEDNH